MTHMRRVSAPPIGTMQPRPSTPTGPPVGDADVYKGKGVDHVLEQTAGVSGPVTTIQEVAAEINTESVASAEDRAHEAGDYGPAANSSAPSFRPHQGRGGRGWGGCGRRARGFSRRVTNA